MFHSSPKRVYCRSIPLGKCDKNYATFRDDRPKKLEPKRSTIQSKSKEQEHAPKIQELYIIYIYISLYSFNYICDYYSD